MNSPKPNIPIPGGLFVAFEGGEGAGKSSQALELKSKLETQGYQVVATREPGATELGKRLRTILLDPALAGSSIVGPEILMLYSADRHAHLRQVVRPALEAGKIVISDRYVFSTIAYQTAEGVPRTDIDTISSIATNNLMPERTYWFDIEPEIGLARITSQGRTEASKYDDADLTFHHELHHIFRSLAKEFSGIVTRIDANQAKGIITDTIYSDILRLLSDKLKP